MAKKKRANPVARSSKTNLQDAPLINAENRSPLPSELKRAVTETYPISHAAVLAEKVRTPKAGDCPYTLFLGAGASVTSGVPTVTGMIEQWKRVLGQNAPNPTDYIEGLVDRLKEQRPSEDEYSLLFSHLFQERDERQMHIEELLDGQQPGFGYFYLAGLIAARRFNRVLTTNFDDLLNDALTKFYDVRPIVCSYDSAVTSIRIASQRPKIIKLHGDFLYDNMKNVESELKRLDENMEGKMREMCKDFGLIVVGYSGRDESIMAPLKEMLRKPGYLKMGLHWCIYMTEHPADDKISIDHPSLSQRLKELLRNHRDRVHLYSVDSFDTLMESMFARCNCPEPPILLAPSKVNLPSQFLDTVENTRSIQPFTDRMSDIYRRIVEGMESGDSSLDYALSKAYVTWEEGKGARSRNDFETAQTQFESTKLQCEELLQRLVLEGRTDDKAPLVQARICARMAGACTGLAKAQRSQGAKKAEFESELRNAIRSATTGLAPFLQLEMTNSEWLCVRSCHYNRVCAFGLLAEQTGGLGKDDELLVRQSLSEYMKYDYNRQQIVKLTRDSDTQSLKLLFREFGCIDGLAD